MYVLLLHCLILNGLFSRELQSRALDRLTLGSGGHARFEIDALLVAMTEILEAALLRLLEEALNRIETYKPSQY